MHQFIGIQQLRQPFQRIIFALQRYEQAVGQRQRIDREQAERRRAIDKDIIIEWGERPHGAAQLVFTRNGVDQLHLCASQLNRRRHQVQIAKAAFADDRSRRRTADQHVIHAMRNLAAVHAQAAGRVALRIHIDQQHFFAALAQRSRKIHRCRRLGHAAFLVDDGDYFTHPRFPFPAKFALPTRILPAARFPCPPALSCRIPASVSRETSGGKQHGAALRINLGQLPQ